MQHITVNIEQQIYALFTKLEKPITIITVYVTSINVNRANPLDFGSVLLNYGTNIFFRAKTSVSIPFSICMGKSIGSRFN